MTPAERMARYEKSRTKSFEPQDRVCLRSEDRQKGVAKGATGTVQARVSSSQGDLYTVRFSKSHAGPSSLIDIPGRDLILCRSNAKRLRSSSALSSISETPSLSDSDHEGATVLDGFDPSEEK